MARIAGVDIPRDKRAVISLTYLYGIGPTVSAQVLDACEIDHSTRVRDLGDQDVAKLRSYIEGNLRVEGDLRREIQQDTVVGFPSAASAPTPTLAPARVPRRPLPARRR